MGLPLDRAAKLPLTRYLELMMTKLLNLSVVLLFAMASFTMADTDVPQQSAAETSIDAEGDDPLSGRDPCTEVGDGCDAATVCADTGAGCADAHLPYPTRVDTDIPG